MRIHLYFAASILYHDHAYDEQNCVALTKTQFAQSLNHHSGSIANRGRTLLPKPKAKQSKAKQTLLFDLFFQKQSKAKQSCIFKNPKQSKAKQSEKQSKAKQTEKFWKKFQVPNLENFQFLTF